MNQLMNHLRQRMISLAKPSRTCIWLCPIFGFTLGGCGVLTIGFLLQWSGTAIAGTHLLLMAMGGGIGAAMIASLCTLRHACFGKMVRDQNDWRPGLQMPQAIGQRDPAILQAAEVNAIITRERNTARIRTRMIVSRLAAATANRVNNAMTVILGSIDIAENRGFGVDFHREIQGVRDGVEDTREVCQKLLGISNRGDMRSRRTNLESHIRNLESRLSDMAARAGMKLEVVISNMSLRVRVSPRRLEDWIIQAMQISLAQCDHDDSISIVLDRCRHSPDLVMIEIRMNCTEGLFLAPQLRLGATSLGGKMEQGVGLEGKAYYRLLMDSLDPLDGLPEDQPEHESDVVQGERKFLLVEDEPQVRRLVAGMLSGYVESIIEAEDGVHGWSEIEKHSSNIDLAIIDVMIPGIGGIELAERIRGRYPSIPVLLITGHDQVEGIDIFQSDAEVVMLGKPFDRKDLNEAISALSLRFTTELACDFPD